MNDHERTLEWIWEHAHGDDAPPDVGGHLAACAVCREERDAREKVDKDLRGLRWALDEAPPTNADRSVLVAARDAVADEAPGFVAGPITTEVHHHYAGNDAPRATPVWMLVAAAILFLSLGVGFWAGRATAPTPPAMEHTTLATLPSEWTDVHKRHTVGLRRSGLDAIMSGSTYLLTGPQGGPYKVVGKVTWDDLDMQVLPAATNEEIVVAVSPQGEWTQGSRLALNDLSDPDVSILARRALAQR